MNYEYSTVIKNEGEVLNLTYNEKPAFYISFDGSFLIAEAYYTVNSKPLVLKAAANLKDNINIRIRPYRIELYINGRLCDEEWPWGEALFMKCENKGSIFTLFEDEIKVLPSVTGEFVNAEKWQPEENVFVGDCMPYVHKGRYHVLYLKDRHNHNSKWGKGAHQWEHISTEDFITWQIHPTAVEIDDPYEGSICTGSFIEANDKEYLYYTVRMSDGSSAPIKRSFSSDGYHFAKDKSFSFLLSGKYKGESARDPKLIKDSSGLFHMFVTSTLKEENKGCLVHLTSSDLEVWKEEAEPIYISNTTEEPECSDYFEYNGFYYLIFSLYGKGHYIYSKEPFSGFIMPDDPIIPCKRVPKAAIFNDKIIFTGYDPVKNDKYAGTMTFKEACVNNKGEMYFNK